MEEEVNELIMEGYVATDGSVLRNSYGSSVTVKKRVTVSQLRYTQKAIDDSKLVEGKVKLKDDCTAKANYEWINPTSLGL